MAVRECSVHPRSMIDSLNALKTRKQLCDVTIIACDEEIKAHRLVLAAASKYFEAMFLNDTKESKTGIVEFPGTSKDVVKQCIDFIYSGNVEFSLHYISEFVKTSDIMGLHNLMNLYIKFLAGNVDLDNVLEILSLVRTYKLEGLKESVQEYFQEHFSGFVKSKTYVLLDEEWMYYLLSLVNDYSKDHEILKWTAILYWIRHDYDERESSFFDLFCTINLSFLSKEFINDDIMNEALVSESTKCLQYLFIHVHNGKPHHNGNRRNKKIDRFLSCNPQTRLLYQYDVTKEKWSRLMQLPKLSTKHLNITEYRGSIYVGNGKQMWHYDGLSWSNLYTNTRSNDEMFNVCFGFGDFIAMVCCYGVVIFSLSSLEISKTKQFDRSNGEAFSVAGSDKKLYIIGGDYSPLSVYEYDVDNETGRYLSTMTYPRKRGVSVWYQDTVYVVGGGSEIVEYYNFTTEQWQSLRNLKFNCIGCKAYLTADKLIIFGGSLELNTQTIQLEELNILEQEKQPTRDNVDLSILCAYTG